MRKIKGFSVYEIDSTKALIDLDFRVATPEEIDDLRKSMTNKQWNDFISG